MSRASRLQGRALVCLFLLIFLTHFPAHKLGMQTDDHLVLHMVQGHTELAALGLATDPAQPLWQRLSNAFNFYSDAAHYAGQTTLAAHRAWGSVPWWGVDSGHMQPWRPLAAASHWLDEKLLDDTRQWAPLWRQAHTTFYLILVAAAAYWVVKRLSGRLLVSVLATSLVVFDISLAASWQWLAARNALMGLALSLFCFGCYLKWLQIGHGGGRGGWLLLSWISFGLGLLAAEGSLGVLAYIAAAWLFRRALVQPPKSHGVALPATGRGRRQLATMRKSLAAGLTDAPALPPARRGIGSLLPFIGLLLVWRWFYSGADFGALGNGLYTDPAQNPLHFFLSLLTRWPLTWAAIPVGVEGWLSALPALWAPALAAITLVIVVLLLASSSSGLRQHPVTAMLLLGSAGALVPFLAAANPGFRSTPLAAFGVWTAVSFWFGSAHLEARRYRRWLRSVLLLWWLVVPMGLVATLSWGLWPSSQAAQQPSARVEMADTEAVVILNTGPPVLLYYLPYELASAQRPLPQRLQQIAPGLTDLEFSRLDAETLHVLAPQGLLTSPADIRAETGLQARVQAVSMGLITPRRRQWQVGDVVQGAGMTVTVTALVGDLIAELDVRFESAAVWDHEFWWQYDWTTHQYVKIPVPVEGEVIRVSGPDQMAR